MKEEQQTFRAAEQYGSSAPDALHQSKKRLSEQGHAEQGHVA